MSRFRLAVAVFVAAAMLTVPVVAAEPATGSILGPSEVAPGETVTYTFTVENTGSEASGYIVNVSLPEGWSVVDRSDAGGNWRSDGTRWVFLSIGAGETKEPSLTLSVPSDATDGSATLGATIEDTDSVRDSSTRTVTVDGEDTTSPTAEAGSDATVSEGTSVSFDGTGSTDNTGIESYEWDWTSDGSYETTGPTPSHTYTTSGTYTVTLRVTDAAGNTATDTATVTVEESEAPPDTIPPTADAGSDRTVDEGDSVSFDGTGSTDNIGIESYEWDVDGDGSSEVTGATPSYTYTTPGTYTVTLGVTDAAGNTATDTVAVTVEDAGDDGSDDGSDDGGDDGNEGSTGPTAEAGPVKTVEEGASVSFDGTDSTDDTGIASYAWDFDDNGFYDATGATPSHTYTRPGTYTVTLRVTDTDGNTARDTTRVTVEDDGGSDTTVVEQYDTNDSGTIERSELGIAAADFVNGDLSRGELGIVAANFASN